MEKLKKYAQEYANDGAQQTIVVVALLTSIGAFLNYRAGKPLYGSMKRAPSAYNRYVQRRVPELMKKGMSAPQAMKMAASQYHD
jgi:hypothetical protein